MANITREEFETIYSNIIETEDMPASEAVKEAMKSFNHALDEYIGEVTKDAFYWGYTIAMRENRG